MHQDLLQLLYGHCIPGLSFGACSFTVLFVAKPCKWPITLYYQTSFFQVTPANPSTSRTRFSALICRWLAPRSACPLNSPEFSCLMHRTTGCSSCHSPCRINPARAQILVHQAIATIFGRKPEAGLQGDILHWYAPAQPLQDDYTLGDSLECHTPVRRTIPDGNDEVTCFSSVPGKGSRQPSCQPVRQQIKPTMKLLIH